jgi:hypothetical protein
MQQKPDKPEAPVQKRPNPAQTRDERLKAALKANMGRRKAQARARASDADDDTKNT